MSEIYTTPYQHFFRPRPRFLKWLAAKKMPIVDIGAGTGHFQAEMRKAHLEVPFISIDLHPRDPASSMGEQENGVQVHITDATTFDYTFGYIVTCCRPNHGGWAYDAMRRALLVGAKVYYVGLAKNLEADWHDLCGWDIRRGIGADGENCYAMDLSRAERKQIKERSKT